jgi:hypothetical protein
MFEDPKHGSLHILQSSKRSLVIQETPRKSVSFVGLHNGDRVTPPALEDLAATAR